MFGIGAGAIAQVIVQIAPSIRDKDGRSAAHPAGGRRPAQPASCVMYATGLLVSV